MNRPSTLTDSSAQWISMRGTRKDQGLYLQFAKRFDWKGEGNVSLEISAVSEYHVWVNGIFIGRGPAVGSAQLSFYHTYTIATSILKQGENLLAVLLFHDGRTTKTTQGFQYGDPGLIARVVGAMEECVTDNSWRVRRAPEYSRVPSMVSKWGGYKEFYHGEKADDWREASFNHRSWRKATVVALPQSPDFIHRLLPVGVPELESKRVEPKKVVEVSHSLGKVGITGSETEDFPAKYSGETLVFDLGAAGFCPSATLDFGNVFVGYPEIALRHKGRCLIELWYGETLDLWRLDVLSSEDGLHWKGVQRRAFRYLKIVLIAAESPVEVGAAAIENSWYDYDERGSLETEDPELNRMVEVSKHTLRANTSYHYEDCPMREKAMWIMDMRVMALINAYLYGNTELTAKCLRQAFAIQRENGRIASTGPKDNDMFHHDFHFHLVGTLKEHFLLTGDHGLVEELYPNVERLHEFIETLKNEQGLLDTDRIPRLHPYLDWSTKIEKLGITTILNSLYKVYLEDLALLAEVVEKQTDASDYLAESQSVASVIHETLFWEEEGLYRDAIRKGKPLHTLSQQANMAALYAGVVPLDQVPGVIERAWRSGEFPPPYGPSYYLIIMEALHQFGLHRDMVEVLHRYWGAMLKRGATTWWEVFDPSTPGWVYPHPFLGNVPTYEMDWIPISTCHGWSGVPGYAIPRYLLGVDLLCLHENKVRIRPPKTPLLNEANYSLPVRGEILKLRFSILSGETKIEVLEKPDSIDIEIQ